MSGRLRSTPNTSPELLAFFAASKEAGKRIEEVGKAIYGPGCGWRECLTKALGLKSTLQLGSWTNNYKCPPDYQERLIAVVRAERDAELAAAMRRYGELSDLIIEMHEKRLPPPIMPTSPTLERAEKSETTGSGAA